MGDAALANGHSDGIGALHRAVHGGVGHQHHEFFTPIAAGEVGGTNRALEAFGNGRQHRVACGMTKGVVEAFEVVDVNHENGERLTTVATADEQALQGVFHVAPVVQARQGVAQGQGAQGFAQLQVGKAGADPAGQRGQTIFDVFVGVHTQHQQAQGLSLTMHRQANRRLRAALHMAAAKGAG